MNGRFTILLEMKNNFKNLERPQFNNFEKNIEIPKEELQAIQDIFLFSEKLSEEGYAEDSVYASSNSNFTAEELEKMKTDDLSQTLESISDDETFNLRRKIKREAQY
jgi:hypothetical protein